MCQHHKLSQLEKTNNSTTPKQLTALKLENEKLKKEVEVWKQKLIQAGLSHGVRNFSTSAAVHSGVLVQETTEKPLEKPVPAPAKETKKIKEPKKKDGGEFHVTSLTYLLI